MEFSTSLRKTGEFKRVYREGKSFADRNMVVYVLANGTSQNRLGITASKKYGNSVQRHRFIRRIRAIYRLQENAFKGGLDVVVIARSHARGVEYRELEQSFLHLAGKAHALNRSL